MTLQIVKATKTKSLLRGAIFGPAGSGKTLTSLLIARGFIENAPGKRIGVIDTERRAEKYSGQVEHLKRDIDFDIIDIADEPTIPHYIEALELFASTGQHGFVIIDSSTHAWEFLKDEVSKIAKARYKGNEWAAWSEGTPMQRKFIETLTLYPLHIIWTMRSATEWKTSDSNGKSQPIRVGLKPEQGKNIEYEADFLLEMTTDHICTVLKDTSGKFQDRIIPMPDETFGRAMSDWLNTGIDAPLRTKGADSAQDTAVKFSAKAEEQIRKCSSLEELRNTWAALQPGLQGETNTVRTALTVLKDKVKADLTPKAEPEKKAEDVQAEQIEEAKQSDLLFGPTGDPAPVAPEVKTSHIFADTKATIGKVRSRAGLIRLSDGISGLVDAGEITVEEYKQITNAIVARANELGIQLAERGAA